MSFWHFRVCRVWKQFAEHWCRALKATDAISHASAPRKLFTPAYRAALSEEYSVASFAILRVLSSLHSPSLRCSCRNLVRFYYGLEACILLPAVGSFQVDSLLDWVINRHVAFLPHRDHNAHKNTVVGTNLCVLCPLQEIGRGIREEGVATGKVSYTVHTVNIISQRQYFVACLRSCFWFTYW